jgi:hypothetical protein
LMEGVISNRASAPPPRQEKPSPLAAVWQWANKAGTVIADLRSRISALESRPQARDGVSIASLFIDQDNILVAMLSDGRSIKAGRVTPPAPAIDAASIEDMIARRVEASVAALNAREPVNLTAIQDRIDGVYTALAGFHQPKDGESVTVDDVKPLIAAEVERVVGALPKPESPAPVILPDFDRLISDRVAVAVAAIPPASPGKDVDLLVVQAMVAAEVAKAPRPKDGESVTVDDVRPVISAEVARAVGELPKQEVRAAVVAADLDRMIADRVAVAMAAIPPALPGKDIDPIVVQAMIAAEVAKLPRPKDGVTLGELRPAIDDAVSSAVASAVASLPKPKDGESITIDDITPMVRDEVSRAIRDLPAPPEPIDMALIERFVSDRVAVAVAAIPPALPGKDVDPVVVQAMVAAEVAKLPRPKDGESIEESTIRSMVADAVSAIPAPKDGESISEDAVRSMVVEAVNQIVGAWSPPQDGHTPTEEELAPLVEAAVGRAVSALPKANDGVGIADMIVNGDGRLAVVLTDARRLDAGKVVPDAVEGPPGRSVKDADVNEDGVLVLTMSDGETIVAGAVVGPPGKDIKGDAGRGVASLRIVANDLVATFTDGDEQLIGRVVGKPGKPGQSIKGDPGSTFMFSDSYAASGMEQFRVVEMVDDAGNVRRMITLD